MFWACKLTNNKPISITGDNNAILSITNISLVENKKHFDKKERICLHMKDETNDIIFSKISPAFQRNLKVHLITNLSQNKKIDIYITGANCELHLIGNVQRKRK